MAIPPEDREIRVDAALWELEANPGRIESAATAWRRLPTNAKRCRGRVRCK